MAGFFESDWLVLTRMESDLPPPPGSVSNGMLLRREFMKKVLCCGSSISLSSCPCLRLETNLVHSLLPVFCGCLRLWVIDNRPSKPVFSDFFFHPDYGFWKASSCLGVPTVENFWGFLVIFFGFSKNFVLQRVSGFFFWLVANFNRLVDEGGTNS